jgi:hypothetical protein
MKFFQAVTLGHFYNPLHLKLQSRQHLLSEG